MQKTKKIIISLIIAMVILIVINYVVVSYTNSQFVELPVFKESMLKGKRVDINDITKIQVKRTKQSEELLQGVLMDKFQDEILKIDVLKGEIASKEKFVLSNEFIETNSNYQYISIPITNLSYTTCSKLKRGDEITIYYTAKNKDVSNVIKDKKKIYSNASQDGLVTCVLFEKVEAISIHDNTGKETKDNIVTDVLIRVKKEQAMLVANLKSQGTFDVILN